MPPRFGAESARAALPDAPKADTSNAAKSSAQKRKFAGAERQNVG
jgi:hypothetical protein